MKLLRLCSGGRLIYDYGWQREPEDVTERGHQFLFEPLVVQSSFKVRDVLALMRACPELQEIYGRWFVRDFLEDTELGVIDQAGPAYARVQFLQLETVWEKSDEGDFLEYDYRLDLSGYSMVQRRDRYSEMARRGERIRYGMEGSLRPYLDLPLRIETDILLFTQGSLAPNSMEPYSKVKREKVILGQIIEGFFYSVSFFGPPEKFKKIMQDMHEMEADKNAWHVLPTEELEDPVPAEANEGSGRDKVFDHFMSRYPAHKLYELDEQIFLADEDIPIKRTLHKKFGKQVQILPEFSELTGRAFRLLYRLKCSGFVR